MKNFISLFLTLLIAVPGFSNIHKTNCSDLNDATELTDTINECKTIHLGKNSFDFTGKIFFDFNRNGFFDTDDYGMDEINIVVNKIQETDPCPGSTGIFYKQSKTNTAGDFIIRDVVPGSYIITISPDYFTQSASLYGYIFTTVQSYCIDIDEFTDPEELQLYFGLYSDCSTLTEAASSPDCYTASQKPVICNLHFFDAFCGEMFQETSPGIQPDPLCPEGGQAENMQWFSFIAGYGDYSILIIPFNCNPGSDGKMGIQAGIYADCNFQNLIFCDSDCNLGLLEIPGNQLIPGQVYYLFINGCGGSYCDYEMDIIGTYSPYKLSEPDSLYINHDLCNTLCTNKDITFTLAGLDLPLRYEWSVFNENGDVVDSLFPAGSLVSEKNSIKLRFTQPGIYTVCMKKASNQCDYTDVYCVDAEISESDIIKSNYQEIITESGVPFEQFISIDGDSTNNFYILPIQNEDVSGMIPDTLFSGKGLFKQILFNKTNSDQHVYYTIISENNDANCCLIPDSLKVTILPTTFLYEEDIRVCKDSCVLISAAETDSSSLWTDYFWENGDTNAEVYICPSSDTLITLFVRDTNNIFYRIHFNISLKNTDVLFELQNDFMCGDTMFTIMYDATSDFDSTQVRLFYVYDCYFSDTIPIYSADTAGWITLPDIRERENYCYTLRARTGDCATEKSLIFTNPNYIIGKTCDDNDPNTINDVFGEDCICKGGLNNATGNEITDEIKIFPNPTNENVFVINTGISEDMTIFLFNAFGEKVAIQKSTIENGYELYTTGLSAGVYFVKVSKNNVSSSFKIVKY